MANLIFQYKLSIILFQYMIKYFSECIFYGFKLYLRWTWCLRLPRLRGLPVLSVFFFFICFCCCCCCCCNTGKLPATSLGIKEGKIVGVVGDIERWMEKVYGGSVNSFPSGWVSCLSGMFVCMHFNKNLAYASLHFTCHTHTHAQTHTLREL